MSQIDETNFLIGPARCVGENRNQSRTLFHLAIGCVCVIDYTVANVQRNRCVTANAHVFVYMYVRMAYGVCVCSTLFNDFLHWHTRLTSNRVERTGNNTFNKQMARIPWKNRNKTRWKPLRSE